MKQLFTSKDFKEYFNKTDGVVAATIAQEKFELLMTKLLKDPTNGAKGEFAEGFRTCLKDIINELGE